MRPGAPAPRRLLHPVEPTVSLSSDINAGVRRARARLRRLFRRRERCPACGRRIRPRDHVVRDLDAHGARGTYHQLCALDLHAHGEEGQHDSAGRERTFGRRLARRHRDGRQT